MPLCARCTGVLIGQFMSLVLLISGLKLGFFSGIIFISIMGIDWGLQEIKILESTNIRRLITGIVGGYGLFTIYINIFIFLIGLVM